eukprot:TRINITY_DN650_c0_g1_i1.p1 TRINITY_DN650_c0_g1~~TRINITY_DN650_c0_g1_i1.p1  ORF type:complete len:331 (+),score=168.16 TRINITY_DN650_c0_g1_i1:50-1042(+)
MFWSLKIPANTPTPLNCLEDLRISQATLGECKDDKRHFVKITYMDLIEDENRTTIITSLSKNGESSKTLDVCFDRSDSLTFKCTADVYLCGSYIIDLSNFSEEEEEEDEGMMLPEGWTHDQVEKYLSGQDFVEDSDEEDSEDEEDEQKIREIEEDDEVLEFKDQGDVPQDILASIEKKLNKKRKQPDSKRAGKEPEKKKAKRRDSTEEKTPEKPQGKKAARTKKTKSGLIIEDVQIGKGRPCTPGKQVTVHYIGRLKKNNKVFDRTKKQPFEFRLGVGEVIKGWDEGVRGMKSGGKRILTIPPKLGYGKRGAPPDIPPNSTLVFEITLVR